MTFQFALPHNDSNENLMSYNSLQGKSFLLQITFAGLSYVVLRNHFLLHLRKLMCLDKREKAVISLYVH